MAGQARACSNEHRGDTHMHTHTRTHAHSTMKPFPELSFCLQAGIDPMYQYSLAYFASLFSHKPCMVLLLCLQAGIDPMYQYSLAYFASLFSQCISAAPPSEDLPTRLNSLLNYITEFMYKMVGTRRGVRICV